MSSLPETVRVEPVISHEILALIAFRQNSPNARSNSFFINKDFKKKYRIIQCEFDEFERFYYDLAASCFLQTIIFLKAQQATQVIRYGSSS
jgi:hypothetical protein